MSSENTESIEAPNPPPLSVALDPVAALFHHRWQQECQLSLSLAAEKRILIDELRLARLQIENFEKMIQQAKDAASAAVNAPAPPKR